MGICHNGYCLSMLHKHFTVLLLCWLQPDDRVNTLLQETCNDY
jgi:hypothetical protein